jgi:hypothetical protein
MTYLFPIATTSSVGVVQAGANISIDAAGVISTTGGGSATIGTWVPTILVASAGTITLLVETARYAKIGQQVICYFDITVASCSLGANTNVLTMGGLPFTSIAGVGVVGSLVVSVFENLNVNQSYITGTIEGNSTLVQLYTIHNAASNSRLTYADVQVTPLPTRLVGTITYLSAS